MGQKEVFEYLKNQKNDRFFTAEEITKGMGMDFTDKDQVKKNYNHLLSLTQYNFLEMRGIGIVCHKKTFRFKINK